MAELWLFAMLVAGPAAALLLTVPEPTISISAGNAALLPASLNFSTLVPDYFQVRWQFVTGARLVLMLKADNCVGQNGIRHWRDSCEISTQNMVGYRHRAALSSEDVSLVLWDARVEDSGIYCVTLLALGVKLSANINLTVNNETSNSQYNDETPDDKRRGIHPSKGTGETASAIFPAGSSASTYQAEHSSKSSSPSVGEDVPVSLVKTASGRDYTVSNIIQLSLAGLIFCLLGLITAEHISFTYCKEKKIRVRDGKETHLYQVGEESTYPPVLGNMKMPGPDDLDGLYCNIGC